MAREEKRCSNCKWWDDELNPSRWGDCTNKNITQNRWNKCNSDAVILPDNGAGYQINMATGINFCCIHHVEGKFADFEEA